MSCNCRNTLPASCIIYDGEPISCLVYPDNPTVTNMIEALGIKVCATYDVISAGSNLTVRESDGSPEYTLINNLRFNQDSGFVVTQPAANAAEVRLIPVFLAPDSTWITVDAVTTANITLSGAQTIDTIVGVAGTTRVLVWKQTDQTENGVYVQAVGAWTRATDSDTGAELNNQVVFANYIKSGTTYGGNYFNQITVSPSIGVDDVIYQKGGGSDRAWKRGGNTVEQVEIFGTLDNFSIPFRTNNTERMRLFDSGELGIGINTSPLGTVHIKSKGSSQSPLYISNNAETTFAEFSDAGNLGLNITPNANYRLHIKGSGTSSAAYSLFAQSSSSAISFAFRNDGYIFRNGTLYSTLGGSSNTSWGHEALLNNATVQNTAVGYRAGKSLTTGGGSTLFGYLCGTALTTQNWNCFYGDEVGLDMTDAVQNTLIGTKIATSVTSGGFGGNVIVGYTGGDSLTGGCHDNTLIGNYVSRRLYSALARATIHGNIMIGDYCGDDVDGSYNILIGNEGGWNMETGTRNIFIGHAVDNYSFSSGDITNSVSTPDISDSLSLGNRTTVTANNQVVIGSEVYPYTELYIGEGVLSTTPGSISINATGGSGTDIAGGDLILAGGKGTSAGTPGAVLIKTGTIASTGSTLQSLGTRVSIDQGKTWVQNRLESSKGTSTAAANDLTLPYDGNSFTITGNTTINAITTANWVAGSIIYLIFTGTPTVKQNTAGGAGTATMKLLAGVDFVIAKNPTVLGLLYDGTNWLEISRSANAV